MWLSDVFSPEWLITVYYLVILAVIVAAAKTSSALAGCKTLRGETQFLFLAPVLSVRSWQQKAVLSTSDRRLLLQKGIVVLPLMVIVFLWVPVLTSGLPWWIRSYLAILPFWLLIETIQLLMQLCWLPVGRCVPAINRQPLAARTVAEFWGRRWNRLFGDWLRQMCFQPLARRPILALFVTFISSGLIHEALVSLPLWLVYRVNCFGWMVGYFLLQFLAILAEKRWLRASPGLNRLYVWSAVLAPVPLILNQGTLLVFHLAVVP